MRPTDVAAPDGLVERAALMGAGIPKGTISTWLTRGKLMEVLPGVYRIAEGDLPWKTLCRAAALWGGDSCALSHHTAAALHGLRCFLQQTPIHLSAMDSRKKPTSPAFELILHTPRTLKEEEVTIAAGLRVTSMGRTLIDLAATMSPAALDHALGEALRRGLVSPAEIRRVRESGRGRKGTTNYTNVIDLRGAALVRTDSKLEDKFMKAFVDEGLELLPEPRVWIAKWDMVYRADFAFTKYKLAIEIDSWEHHSRFAEWNADVIKNNDVVAWGWSVLRFTASALADMNATARTIREALVSRGW